MNGDATPSGAAAGSAENTGPNSQACCDAVGVFYTPVDPVNSAAPTELAADKFVPPHLSEVQLEAAIEAAKQRMCEAPERSEKLRHWRTMVRLIDQRSPSRVRFMERMRNLA